MRSLWQRIKQPYTNRLLITRGHQNEAELDIVMQISASHVSCQRILPPLRRQPRFQVPCSPPRPLNGCLPRPLLLLLLQPCGSAK